MLFLFFVVDTRNRTVNPRKAANLLGFARTRSRPPPTRRKTIRYPLGSFSPFTISHFFTRKRYFCTRTAHETAHENRRRPRRSHPHLQNHIVGFSTKLCRIIIDTKTVLQYYDSGSSRVATVLFHFCGTGRRTHGCFLFLESSESIQQHHTKPLDYHII